MATIMICDRCGKVIDEKDNYKFRLLSRCDRNMILGAMNNIKEKDLCQKCCMLIVPKILDLIDANIPMPIFDKDTVTSIGGKII